MVKLCVFYTKVCAYIKIYRQIQCTEASCRHISVSQLPVINTKANLELVEKNFY